MKIDIAPHLLAWDATQAMLDDLFLDYADRSRAATALAMARKIAADVGAVVDQVRARPHMNPDDDNAIIEAERSKARVHVAGIAKTIDALKSEHAALATLPESSAKGVDPDDVKIVRARLDSMDPVSIAGEYAAAVASGDMTTLHAVSTANPAAYPNIHRAMSANPSLRHEASIQVRSAVNPDARRAIEAKEVLIGSLGAVLHDVETIVGAPDAIARQATATGD